MAMTLRITENTDVMRHKCMKVTTGMLLKISVISYGERYNVAAINISNRYVNRRTNKNPYTNIDINFNILVKKFTIILKCLYLYRVVTY